MIAHTLGLLDKHEITTVVPSELNKGGKSSGQTLVSHTRIVDPNYGNYHASYWSNSLLIYTHFGIEFVHIGTTIVCGHIFNSSVR